MSRVLSLLALSVLAVPASAQECTIAAYADPGGVWSEDAPDPFVEDSLYVIIFTEDTVAAAAYSIELPQDVFVQARFSGPSGNGLVIDEPTGTSVALAECAIGFGGLPVRVDEYRYIVIYPMMDFVTLGPNASQDPDFPQYVTCNDIIRDCSLGPPFYMGHVDPVYETGFSEIKALYHRN